MKKLLIAITFILGILNFIPEAFAGPTIFAGFSLTPSGETTFSSCASVLRDYTTRASYAGVGACTPHWKTLNMNGNPVGSVGSLGIFGAATMTPNTPNAPPAAGALIVNVIHMIGLDIGAGPTFNGHWMGSVNFSDQTFIDQLTK